MEYWRAGVLGKTEYRIQKPVVRMMRDNVLLTSLSWVAESEAGCPGILSYQSLPFISMA